MIKFMHSVSFRLTVLYVSLSAFSMLIVLAVSFVFLQSSMTRQVDQELLNEIAEYGGLLASQSLDIMKDVLDRETVSEGTDTIFFQILNGSGDVLLSTETSAWNDLQIDPAHVHAAAEGRTVFDSVRYPEQEVNFRLIYGRVGNDMVMVIGDSLASEETMLRHFRRVFVVAAGLMAGISVLAGMLLAQRALAGVNRVSAVARAITAGALERRVPVGNHDDEFDQLASAFNAMIDRIQILIRELKEVSDDIAHDIRTPISRMRASAELALARSERGTLPHEDFGVIIGECDELLALINTMLEISQTEAGATPDRRAPIDLGHAIAEIGDLFAPAAEDKGLRFNCDVPRGLRVHGDVVRLNRAFANIIDNAIKYTPAGGTVGISAALEPRQLRILVTDTGIGIPASEQSRVFARFYRGDKSRSDAGNGLGLSLARAIIRAHGGEITVQSNPGEGTAFTVVLPALQPE